MSDLVEQLQRLAELHKSGVLTDEEFQAAKRARISAEAGGGTPAPNLQTSPGPPETCEIKVEVLERKAVLDSTWRYFGLATGPQGEYTAAITSRFKAAADYFAFEYFPARNEQQSRAFDRIVNALHQEGWRQLPYEGKHWWNKRFERTWSTGDWPARYWHFYSTVYPYTMAIPSRWVDTNYIGSECFGKKELQYTICVKMVEWRGKSLDDFEASVQSAYKKIQSWVRNDADLHGFPSCTIDMRTGGMTGRKRRIVLAHMGDNAWNLTLNEGDSPGMREIFQTMLEHFAIS